MVLFQSLSRLAVSFALVLGLAACATPQAEAPAVQAPAAVTTKPLATVVYRQLENGLKVVLAPDAAIPTTTIGVYYHIGFRLEPKGRTGFAHLFEHMMFQGSENLPKGKFDELILGNGGVLNGSTRFDYTNYYQVVPSNVTEAVLWAEADRMRTLNLTEETLKNQKDVVINEVKQNVLNQPYGGFPWLDMPQAAFTNWHNAHNFYGDLNDIDAATLDEARAFHASYYQPNNAVVVIAGDLDVEQTFAWVQKYFGPIARRPLPARPDLSEPAQTAEKRVERTIDNLPRPAIAIAYQVPERWTPEWYAMGIIDSILTDGDDGLMVQKLVREKGYTNGLMAGINYGLGNMFSYQGPMLWTLAMVHDLRVPPREIVADAETVFSRLRDQPVTKAEIDRARIRLRSSLYDISGSANRFGLVDLLASFALFDNDPALLNKLEAGFAQVTPEIVQKTAQQYLNPAQRTALELQPTIAIMKPIESPPAN
jgi:zinc protease